MENLKIKPPRSVIAFYVRIFCKKKKSMSSMEATSIKKALRSWFSLSAAEQQPFINKFKKCEEIYQQECATYLKTVEPFLKKKTIRENVNDCMIQESEENNCDINVQLYADDQHLVEKSYNHVSGSVSDLDAEESLTGQQTKIETTEEIQILPEPTPPYMKNGKELFDAVNNKTDDNNTQWKDLSQIERGKYRNAVLTIKRDYIKHYQKYLESLSSKQLYQHYIKSMEEYLLVVLFSQDPNQI